MSKRYLALLLCVGLYATPSRTFAASPLCLAGCVQADIGGLKDVADALKQWAQLLPSLNERFHENVREDVREMDRVATNLVDKLDRIYGRNLDLTNQTVKQLIEDATLHINQVGERAFEKYKLALFETECTVESISEIVAGRIEESIPRFQWIRSLFGERFNVLSSPDFDGKTIEVMFDPQSRTDRFQAAFKLMTLKLNSVRVDTKLERPLAIALDRQRLAYSYYCAVRASVGSIDGVGHVYTALQTARQEYLALSRLVQ